MCLLCCRDQCTTQVINPEPVKRAISTHKKHFAGYAQQDAHEFLVSCLAQIEEDLTPPKPVAAPAPAAPVVAVPTPPTSPKAGGADAADANMYKEERLDKADGKDSPKRPAPGSAPPSPKRVAFAPPPDIAPPAAPSAPAAPPQCAINEADPISKNFDSLVEHSLCCNKCGHTSVMRELFRDFSLEFPTPTPKPVAKPSGDEKGDDKKKVEDEDELLLYGFSTHVKDARARAQCIVNAQVRHECEV